MYTDNVHRLHLCMDYMLRIFRLLQSFLLFIEITYVQKMVPYWHMFLYSHFLSNVTLIKKTKSTILKRKLQGTSLWFFIFFWLRHRDDIEFSLSLIFTSLNFLKIKFRKKIVKNRNPKWNSKFFILWKSRLNDESTSINSDT